MAPDLKIDFKRIRLELESQVSRLVPCEMTDVLSSEVEVDLGYISGWDWQNLLMRVDMG